MSEEDISSNEALSKEQKETRDVFTGCAEMVENNTFKGSIGQCVDKGIVSTEEAKNGNYHLTKLGKKAQKIGEGHNIKMPNGQTIHIEN